MLEWIHALILFVIAVVICATYYRSRFKEGFTSSDTAKAGMEAVGAYGTSVFNPLAIMTDPTKPNFIGSDDPTAIANTNQAIADATRTPRARAGLGDQAPIGSNGTGIGLYSEKPPYQIPANTAALANAKRCAEVKNCGMLADPRYKDDCGMCIKGGTDYTGNNPGTYVGGLYVDPSDSANVTDGVYSPSFGSCPPLNGNVMFRTAFDGDTEPCTKETNRQTCRDVGGGIAGLSTPNASHCAFAQASQSFVYQDPTDPTFPVSLRVTTPTGVTTTVQIFSSDGKQQLAIATSNGGDAVATVSAKEGTPVYIRIGQSVPQNGRRGFAAQWEGSSASVLFEKTIQGVVLNNTPQSQVIDGSPRPDKKLVRKFGSLGGSTALTASPTSVSSSANWIWGATASEQIFICSSFIPGLFQAPTYSEDDGLQGTMPLIGKADTATKIQLGACNKPDQRSGNYSQECLLDLFVSAGGDAVNGGLVASGLSTLNQKGSSDEISNYLADLYLIATTGKSGKGTVQSADAINEASQAMFGFNVASPCESIVQNNDGSLGFVPIPAPLSVECRKYLWENTGNDRDRGDEDRSRKTTIQNTYVSIRDRWSGLRSNESTDSNRSAHPFRTCTPSGTEYPLNGNNTINWSAMSVSQLQDTYNTIYKNANYGKGDLQSQGLAQCYGIKKAADPRC